MGTRSTVKFFTEDIVNEDYSENTNNEEYNDFENFFILDKKVDNYLYGKSEKEKLER